MAATVLGAGFLGTRVCEALAVDGEVSAISRTGQWRGTPPPNTTLRACDLTDCGTEALARLIAAGRPLIVCQAAGRHQDRVAVYVDGARTVANACERARPSRVIYTSSTSALPDVDGPVDESEPRWPDTPRGKVQRQAEAALAEGLARANIPLTILRLGGVYGPGRGLARLYRKAPAERMPGDGMQATNLIHVDDAVSAVVAAARLDPPYEGVLHVCADDHTPRRMLMQRVAEALGHAGPAFDAPAPASGEIRGKIVVNDAVKEVLGLQLRHPHHQIVAGDASGGCAPSTGD